MAQHGSSAAPSAVDASPISPLPGGASQGLTPSQFPHQASSTPTIPQNPSQPQHKRVYQACIPCRRRKVRCDLGSVDNPNDPPCVRCRRESKECYFSATRRKRKHDDDTTESLLDDAGNDDYIIRNGRKRIAGDDSPPPRLDRRLYSEVPLTPGGTRGRSQPLRRPGERDGYHSSVGSIEAHRRSTSEFGNVEPNQPLENFEAKQVMRTEVYGPHDALDLLYKAATDKSVTETMAAPPMIPDDILIPETIVAVPRSRTRMSVSHCESRRSRLVRFILVTTPVSIGFHKELRRAMILGPPLNKKSPIWAKSLIRS